MSNSPSTPSGSSPASRSAPKANLPFVTHEMAGRFMTPLRLLGWGTMLFAAWEIVAFIIFSVKLKNTGTEWALFTMTAERAWGYLMTGLAFALLVPAGPISRLELFFTRLAHYLCAICFVLCLLLFPFGWTRWTKIKTDMLNSFQTETAKTDSLYKKTGESLANETDLERMLTISKVAGLYESVKTITNPGELRAELLRRLTLESTNRKSAVLQNLADARNQHKMALVRSFGALGLSVLFLALFWWHSRQARKQLVLASERKNNAGEFFPYA